MGRANLIRVLLIGLAAQSTCGPVFSQEVLSAAENQIRRSIEAVLPSSAPLVFGQPVYATIALPEFYRGRSYELVWSAEGAPRKSLAELVSSIERADEHGLKPGDYHLEAIRQLRDALAMQDAGTLRTRTLADLDLLATDAFLVFAAHLQAGRVDPTSFDAEWHASRRGADAKGALDRAVETGRIRETLERLLPRHNGYARLKAALGKYREIAATGGFSAVSPGPALQPGDRGSRIAELATRLRQAGDLASSASAFVDSTYDENLALAVRSFQRRHGLSDDGVVGPATLAALNEPISERIDRIAFNLERWRWLPEDLGRKHILVNIAAFELGVFEDRVRVMTKRVVIGRAYRRTPVFSGMMTYLVFSPYWHVPRRLAVQDKLPLIKASPDYLRQQGLRVFSSSDNREIDPSTVDWSGLTAANFNMLLRQDPGPLNALGGVKFMFPNRFNVYLHDTPSRELFRQAERAFSSGCIRVEEPLDVAEYLLAGDKSWTRDRIESAAGVRRETTVVLNEPVPVHIQYWTAWVDDDGTLQFRRDIYGRDVSLAKAMNQPPPKAI